MKVRPITNHARLLQKAGRLIAEALKKLRWKEDDLKSRRKGDAIKAELANRLRVETTVTWRWIAERLAMGHGRTARNAARNIGKKTQMIVTLVSSDPFTSSSSSHI